MTNYPKIKEEIQDPSVCLVAVSKGVSLEKIQEAYFEGARDFGENRLPEALEKIQKLPSDIRWHWIGPLQSNKVSKVVQYFTLIHSVDSLKLAEKINQAAASFRKKMPVLLQVNISQEATKQGFSKEELEKDFLSLCELPSIEIQGLMTMAPFHAEEFFLHTYFKGLFDLREKLKTKIHPLPFLSMGMSHDFQIALEEGATHLRIGSAIFNVLSKIKD